MPRSFRGYPRRQNLLLLPFDLPVSLSSSWLSLQHRGDPRYRVTCAYRSDYDDVVVSDTNSAPIPRSRSPLDLFRFRYTWMNERNKREKGKTGAVSCTGRRDDGSFLSVPVGPDFTRRPRRFRTSRSDLVFCVRRRQRGKRPFCVSHAQIFEYPRHGWRWDSHWRNSANIIQNLMLMSYSLDLYIRHKIW